MPRRQTAFFAGGYYHIYNRGNNHEAIFFERENYLFFLRQLRKYFARDAVEIVTYCLMPNHYHLLICLKTDALADIVQRFTLSYSKAIGKRFNRVGTLFQGPFKAIWVEKEEYLLQLSRYIHLNPVNAGLVVYAEDWEFSSYRDYIGLRNGTLIVPEIIRAYLPTPRAYREFVESYQDDRQLVGRLGMD
ncbi:MAG: transposase [Anaerolineales bacterium]|nr:transposase [Anaerolineales bacterium]